MCKDQPHLSAIVGFAVSGRDERIAGSAGTLVTAWRVGAQLVTVTPVLALILIDECSLIHWIDGHSFVTVTNTSFQRRATLELAVQGITQLR